MPCSTRALRRALREYGRWPGWRAVAAVFRAGIGFYALKDRFHEATNHRFHHRGVEDCLAALAALAALAWGLATRPAATVASTFGEAGRPVARRAALRRR